MFVQVRGIAKHDEQVAMSFVGNFHYKKYLSIVLNVDLHKVGEKISPIMPWKGCWSSTRHSLLTFLVQLFPYVIPIPSFLTFSISFFAASSIFHSPPIS